MLTCILLTFIYVRRHLAARRRATESLVQIYGTATVVAFRAECRDACLAYSKQSSLALYVDLLANEHFRTPQEALIPPGRRIAWQGRSGCFVDHIIIPTLPVRLEKKDLMTPHDRRTGTGQIQVYFNH